MSVIYGATVLLVYQLIGEVGVHALALPVPGPVLGMVLLLLTLILRDGVAASLETTANGLLAHLSLLFVPAGVGLMVHLERIGAEWAAILIALVASTLITMAFTAGLMVALQRLRRAGAPRDG